MPITPVWYFNHRVLCIQFDAEVSAEDIDRFEAQLQSWQKRSVRPVHLIVNHRNTQHMPENWSRLAAFLQDFACAEPNTNGGWQLEVNSGMGIGTFLSSMVQQVRGERTRRFETVGAALAFLREHDPVLPGLLLNTELA